MYGGLFGCTEYKLVNPMLFHIDMRLFVFTSVFRLISSDLPPNFERDKIPHILAHFLAHSRPANKSTICNIFARRPGRSLGEVEQQRLSQSARAGHVPSSQRADSNRFRCVDFSKRILLLLNTTVSAGGRPDLDIDLQTHTKCVCACLHPRDSAHCCPRGVAKHRYTHTNKKNNRKDGFRV